MAEAIKLLENKMIDLQALLEGLDFLLAQVVLVYPNLNITVTTARLALDFAVMSLMYCVTYTHPHSVNNDNIKQ